MAEWVYTFCDLLTGEELAILPVGGVQCSRALNGAGAFSGFVALLDPEVRAVDPWAATEPRRTALYVEHTAPDWGTGRPTTRVVWSGVVWAAVRSADSLGLSLTGATWESWLAHRLLRADLTGTQLTAAQMIAALVDRLQAEMGGDIGLAVVDTTGGALRDRTWAASDGKAALDLINSYTETQKPIEWRVDVTRDPVTGGFIKTLAVGEPKLGRRVADSQIELRYPQGELLDWQEQRDGTKADTALLGIGGTPPVADEATTTTEQPKLTVYRTATAVASNELLDGYPLLETAYSASNQTSLNGLTDATDAQLLAGLNTQSRWASMSVRADGEFGLGGYQLGDDATLMITHPAFREWPGPFTDTVRIIGENITPAEGTTPDTLKLTLGLDGRLATSVTLTATLQRLLSRVASLETS